MDTNNQMQDGLRMEFEALRSEILVRIELRHKIIEYALTVLGVLLGAALAIPNGQRIVLIYPLLAIFLAASWAQNDFHIKTMGQHIRIEMESGQIPGLSWESKNKINNRRGWSTIRTVSHGALFLFTEIFALGIGFFVSETNLDLSSLRSLLLSKSVVDYVLAGLDIAAIILTIVAIRQQSRVAFIRWERLAIGQVFYGRVARFLPGQVLIDIGTDKEGIIPLGSENNFPYKPLDQIKVEIIDLNRDTKKITLRQL